MLPCCGQGVCAAVYKYPFLAPSYLLLFSDAEKMPDKDVADCRNKRTVVSVKVFTSFTFLCALNLVRCVDCEEEMNAFIKDVSP